MTLLRVGGSLWLLVVLLLGFNPSSQAQSLPDADVLDGEPRPMGDLLQLLAGQNILDLLNFELLSERCLNDSQVLRREMENPIQKLTDGFWNLKSEFLIIGIFH